MCHSNQCWSPSLSVQWRLEHCCSPWSGCMTLLSLLTSCSDWNFSVKKQMRCLLSGCYHTHCYTCGVYDWVERLLTESTASKISILRETRFMNEQELFKEIVEQSKTRTYTIRSLTSNTVIMSSCRKFFAGVAGGLSGRSSVRRPGSECGGNFWIVFLINFLAKSGNSKHFSFFSFPPPQKKEKIVVTMFAWHLRKKWSLCLPAISITHQGCACT